MPIVPLLVGVGYYSASIFPPSESSRRSLTRWLYRGAVEKVLFLHNCNRLRREFIITTKP